MIRSACLPLALTALLFALYLIFWDPGTRRLFRKTHQPVVERPVI